MDRVAVFFDYQNVSGWARRCFATSDGHIWPKATADLLVNRRLRPSMLVETLVYRGRPNPTRQSVSARANDRQTTEWEATGATVVRRNLQYPPQWPSVPASEKGIDVALAALADHLAARDGWQSPAWAHSPTRTTDAWYPDIPASARSKARVESPEAFRRRGIYLTSRSLERA